MKKQHKKGQVKQHSGGTQDIGKGSIDNRLDRSNARFDGTGMITSSVSSGYDASGSGSFDRISRSGSSTNLNPYSGSFSSAPSTGPPVISPRLYAPSLPPPPKSPPTPGSGPSFYNPSASAAVSGAGSSSGNAGVAQLQREAGVSGSVDALMQPYQPQYVTAFGGTAAASASASTTPSVISPNQTMPTRPTQLSNTDSNVNGGFGNGIGVPGWGSDTSKLAPLPQQNVFNPAQYLSQGQGVIGGGGGGGSFQSGTGGGRLAPPTYSTFQPTLGAAGNATQHGTGPSSSGGHRSPSPNSRYVLRRQERAGSAEYPSSSSSASSLPSSSGAAAGGGFMESGDGNGGASSFSFNSYGTNNSARNSGSFAAGSLQNSRGNMISIVSKSGNSSTSSLRERERARERDREKEAPQSGYNQYGYPIYPTSAPPGIVSGVGGNTGRGAPFGVNMPAADAGNGTGMGLNRAFSLPPPISTTAPPPPPLSTSSTSHRSSGYAKRDAQQIYGPYSAGGNIGGGGGVYPTTVRSSNPSSSAVFYGNVTVNSNNSSPKSVNSGSGSSTGNGSRRGGAGGSFSASASAYARRSSSRIDPSQMPRPDRPKIDKMYNTRSVLGRKNPPAVNNLYTAIDTGNCLPQHMRMTTVAPPTTRKVHEQTGIPLAVLATPFAPFEVGEDAPAVVDLMGEQPVRCEGCNGYINPSVGWINEGHQWMCNLCGTANQTPAWYYCGLDGSGQRLDRLHRPELQLGTIDIIVDEADYSVRDLQEPIFVYAIDISDRAIASGVTIAAIRAVRASLRRLRELDLDSRVDKLGGGGGAGVGGGSGVVGNVAHAAGDGRSNNNSSNNGGGAGGEQSSVPIASSARGGGFSNVTFYNAYHGDITSTTATAPTSGGGGGGNAYTASTSASASAGVGPAGAVGGSLLRTTSTTANAHSASGKTGLSAAFTFGLSALGLLPTAGAGSSGGFAAGGGGAHSSPSSSMPSTSANAGFGAIPRFSSGQAAPKVTMCERYNLPPGVKAGIITFDRQIQYYAVQTAHFAQQRRVRERAAARRLHRQRSDSSTANSGIPNRNKLPSYRGGLGSEVQQEAAGDRDFNDCGDDDEDGDKLPEVSEPLRLFICDPDDPLCPLPLDQWLYPVGDEDGMEALEFTLRRIPELIAAMQGVDPSSGFVSGGAGGYGGVGGYGAGSGGMEYGTTTTSATAAAATAAMGYSTGAGGVGEPLCCPAAALKSVQDGLSLLGGRVSILTSSHSNVGYGRIPKFRETVGVYGKPGEFALYGSITQILETADNPGNGGTGTLLGLAATNSTGGASGGRGAKNSGSNSRNSSATTTPDGSPRNSSAKKPISDAEKELFVQYLRLAEDCAASNLCVNVIACVGDPINNPPSFDTALLWEPVNATGGKLQYMTGTMSEEENVYRLERQLLSDLESICGAEVLMKLRTSRGYAVSEYLGPGKFDKLQDETELCGIDKHTSCCYMLKNDPMSFAVSRSAAIVSSVLPSSSSSLKPVSSGAKASSAVKSGASTKNGSFSSASSLNKLANSSPSSPASTPSANGIREEDCVHLQLAILYTTQISTLSTGHPYLMSGPGTAATSTTTSPRNLFVNMQSSSPSTADLVTAGIPLGMGMDASAFERKNTNILAIGAGGARYFKQRRMIRVHNMTLIASEKPTTVFRNSDIEAVAVVLFRQALKRALLFSPLSDLRFKSSGGIASGSSESSNSKTNIPPDQERAARAYLENIVCEILYKYRVNCSAQSPKGQLILPESLKVLPVYVLSMLKHPALLENRPGGNGEKSHSGSNLVGMMSGSGGGGHYCSPYFGSPFAHVAVRAGERAHFLRVMNNIPAREVVNALYPRLYCLFAVIDGEEEEEDNEDFVDEEEDAYHASDVYETDSLRSDDDDDDDYDSRATDDDDSRYDRRYDSDPLDSDTDTGDHHDNIGARKKVLPAGGAQFTPPNSSSGSGGVGVGGVSTESREGIAGSSGDSNESGITEVVHAFNSAQDLLADVTSVALRESSSSISCSASGSNNNSALGIGMIGLGVQSMAIDDALLSAPPSDKGFPTVGGNVVKDKKQPKHHRRGHSGASNASVGLSLESPPRGDFETSFDSSAPRSRSGSLTDKARRPPLSPPGAVQRGSSSSGSGSGAGGGPSGMPMPLPLHPNSPPKARKSQNPHYQFHHDPVFHLLKSNSVSTDGTTLLSPIRDGSSDDQEDGQHAATHPGNARNLERDAGELQQRYPPPPSSSGAHSAAALSGPLASISPDSPPLVARGSAPSSAANEAPSSSLPATSTIGSYGKSATTSAAAALLPVPAPVPAMVARGGHVRNLSEDSVISGVSMASYPSVPSRGDGTSSVGPTPNRHDSRTRGKHRLLSDKNSPNGPVSGTKGLDQKGPNPHASKSKSGSNATDRVNASSSSKHNDRDRRLVDRSPDHRKGVSDRSRSHLRRHGARSEKKNKNVPTGAKRGLSTAERHGLGTSGDRKSARSFESVSSSARTPSSTGSYLDTYHMRNEVRALRSLIPSSEIFESDQIYLLDDRGGYLWLYVGRAVPQRVIEELFEFGSNMSQTAFGRPDHITFRTRATNASRRGRKIAAFVEYLRNSGPYKPELTVVWADTNMNHPLTTRFSARLIEDGAPGLSSYVDYLCNLHGKIQNKL